MGNFVSDANCVSGRHSGREFRISGQFRSKAYPKASSKRYQCEFNRDTGWAAVGVAGFESVRQVAIDEDWSALRFRRTEYVKKLTRDASRMSSEAGKSRARKTDKPAE